MKAREKKNCHHCLLILALVLGIEASMLLIGWVLRLTIPVTEAVLFTAGSLMLWYVMCDCELTEYFTLRRLRQTRRHEK